MVNVLHAGLGVAARQARWVLVLGLLSGLIFQDYAVEFKPLIPVFITLLLFVACLRIGPRRAVGALSELHKHLYITLILQIVLPIALLGLIIVIGWRGHYAIALLLVAAAAPVSGSPNLVMMLGHDPAPALRQLVIGTALLPLTVIPVFYFIPELGDTKQTVLAAGKLLAVILFAAVCGFTLSARYFQELSDQATVSIDGISALLMALVVVGLMSALGDAMRNTPWLLLIMLVYAFAINFGLQLAGTVFWGKTLGSGYAVPMSVISGNRNVALYLTALPASVTDDLLLFIGCYQFPMYLTPLLLQRLYRPRSEQTHLDYDS